MVGPNNSLQKNTTPGVPAMVSVQKNMEKNWTIKGCRPNHYVGKKSLEMS